MAKYMTKQRKILQDYLSQRIDTELSAKKVAEDLSDQGISLSAIYRNIADMEKEQQVVTCLKEGSRELYFRYLNEETCPACIHLSCKVCHRIEHLPPEDSSAFQNTMAEKHQFQLDLQSTVFYGVCQDCQSH